MTMTVHCESCNHQWEIALPLPMSLSHFVVIVKSAAVVGCPSCHAYGKAVLCGPAIKK